MTREESGLGEFLDALGYVAGLLHAELAVEIFQVERLLGERRDDLLIKALFLKEIVEQEVELAEEVSFRGEAQAVDVGFCARSRIDPLQVRRNPSGNGQDLEPLIARDTAMSPSEEGRTIAQKMSI